jgi:hypothetical protein
MGNFDVIQRTQDSMFNATKLLQQWNQKVVKKKDMDDFLNNKSTKDFIKSIISREKLNTQNSGYLASSSKSSKKPNTQNSAYLSTRGKNGGTWMHPFLFIDFAMWLNSNFKYDVIKFVYDEMIKYRHEAGDEYKVLSSAIRKIVPADSMQDAMKKIGEALNWIVFNEHESGIRNKFGDEEKQRELFALEKKVADLISEGFITDYQRIVDYLRKLYHKKNYPKVLVA